MRLKEIITEYKILKPELITRGPVTRVISFLNPTYSELQLLLDKYGGMRGYGVENKVVVWPAADAAHVQLRDSFADQYDLKVDYTKNDVSFFVAKATDYGEVDINVSPTWEPNAEPLPHNDRILIGFFTKRYDAGRQSETVGLENPMIQRMLGYESYTSGY